MRKARTRSARLRPRRRAEGAACLSSGPQARTEALPQLDLGHAIPRELLPFKKQHRDLEEVTLLEIGVIANVQLDETEAASPQDMDHDVAHLLAEMAARFAEQGEGVAGRRAQEAERPRAGVRRRSVDRPAPTMIDTIVSWTRRPVRSGWMPIHGTSGKGTGRGGR